MQKLNSKILVPTIILAATVTPLSAFAISHVLQSNGSFATDSEIQIVPQATSAMPAAFADQNLYNCVEAEFKSEFPGEVIPESGLTDTQLAKITNLSCSGAEKEIEQKVANTNGLEKMTALEKLDLRQNQITVLDIHQNTDLEQLQADDITIKTNITSTAVDTGRVFNLAPLKFIGTHDTYTNTIPNTPNYTFDPDTKALMVNNFTGANYFAQITAQSGDYADYKLQLPTLYTLRYNANGGENAPENQECESMDGFCIVNIRTGAPVRQDYSFLGWSTSRYATAPEYQSGEQFELKNADVVLYAVWKENSNPPAPEETTYTIKYDNNGGAGAPDTQVCKSSTGECEFTISTTMPIKPGAYFTGWAKDQSATNGEIHPGETYKTADTETTLYAVYQTTPTAVSTGAVAWKHGKDHKKGSNDDAILNIDYPLTTFTELKLNGKTLEKDKDYSVTTPGALATKDNSENSSKNSSAYSVTDNPDSTTITIKSATLDQLPANTYELVASFTGQTDVHSTISIINADVLDLPVPVLGVSDGIASDAPEEQGANPVLIVLCIVLPILAAALGFVIYRIVNLNRKSALQYYTYQA